MTPSQSRRKPKGNADRAKRHRYDRETYYRAVKYAIQKAARAYVPIADWTPAQLRHLCGTRIRREYGLDAAQVILGHRCAQITEVYAATDRRVGSEIMRSLG